MLIGDVKIISNSKGNAACEPFITGVCTYWFPHNPNKERRPISLLISGMMIPHLWIHRVEEACITMSGSTSMLILKEHRQAKERVYGMLPTFF
jgi:hypothetical protein